MYTPIYPTMNVILHKIAMDSQILSYFRSNIYRAPKQTDYKGCGGRIGVIGGSEL